MEQNFMQEIDRMAAERTELLGSKQFLESQVNELQREMAISMGRATEATEYAQRVDSQVKHLEAKCRHLTDERESGRTQLVKAATTVEAKDAIISELRETVRSLQRQTKRSEAEVKRLTAKLNVEVAERNEFTHQIESILRDMGLSGSMIGLPMGRSMGTPGKSTPRSTPGGSPE